MAIWDEKKGAPSVNDSLIPIHRELERLANGLEHNNELLAEHMKRTALLEAQVEIALLPIKAARVLGLLVAFAATALTTWLAWRQF